MILQIPGNRGGSSTCTSTRNIDQTQNKTVVSTMRSMVSIFIKLSCLNANSLQTGYVLHCVALSGGRKQESKHFNK